MKIGIIGFIDKNKLPYIEYYERVLRKENVKYESIFWDRFNNLKTEKINNEYIIHIKCVPGESKLKKIFPMYQFKNEIQKIISREKYTHLIVLTTLPGILIYKTLLKNFKNKYILDIRDYTYENFNFYKNLVDKLVENSFFTAISSKGFLKFLNHNKKIVPCHNISNFEMQKEDCDDLRKKEQLTIGFVGGVRYYKENCKLIEAFANNPKYLLAYIGEPNIDCNLEEFCSKRKIKNVYFSGKFKNSDKPKIYEKIDLINAVYGNESLEVTTALPNRLYDGLLFKKPIIATKGTYLAEILESKKLGITIDINSENLVEKLDNFINNFDIKKFKKLSIECLNNILIEQDKYEKYIKMFVKQEKI